MAGIPGNDKFCLKWNDYEKNVSTSFQQLRDERDFFDVTLACDGNQLEAHKVILSACSPFFRAVLKRNPHSHPLLYLKGVKYESILAVLNFMYNGEVNIAQAELSAFLSVAEDLQVKGLTKGTSSTSSPPVKRPPVHESPQQTVVRPMGKHRRPASPPSFETQQAREPREGGNLGMALGVPAIKTEHQESSGLESSKETSVPNFAVDEMPPDQFGIPPPDLQVQYQEEMAQALAEGTVGNGRNILLKYVKRTFNKEGNAEDQFKCEICGKIGSRKDNVLNHVENNHFPGTFDYKCKVCTKPMATKKSLENHMYRNHKEMSLV